MCFYVKLPLSVIGSKLLVFHGYGPYGQIKGMFWVSLVSPDFLEVLSCSTKTSLLCFYLDVMVLSTVEVLCSRNLTVVY